MKKDVEVTYSTKLSELRSQLQEMVPAEKLAVFDRDAEQLQKDYPPALKVSIGQKAPAFTLKNALGEVVELYQILKTHKVVLVFYRGSWCPYCNLQLRLYQEFVDDFHSLGAVLVAISPQNADSSLSIKEKNELLFEVLSDPGNLAALQYTTIIKYGEEPFKAMEELGYDFDSFYFDDTREIPIPAVFVIEQDGKVVFAKTEGGDYRNRTEMEEIIEALKISSI